MTCTLVLGAWMLLHQNLGWSLKEMLTREGQYSERYALIAEMKAKLAPLLSERSAISDAATVLLKTLEEPQPQSIYDNIYIHYAVQQNLSKAFFKEAVITSLLRGNCNVQLGVVADVTSRITKFQKDDKIENKQCDLAYMDALVAAPALTKDKVVELISNKEGSLGKEDDILLEKYRIERFWGKQVTNENVKDLTNELKRKRAENNPYGLNKLSRLLVIKTTIWLFSSLLILILRSKMLSMPSSLSSMLCLLMWKILHGSLPNQCQ